MKECKSFRRLHSPYTRLVEGYIYIARLHRNVLERQLNKTGVYRSQHQLLMYIADNPNVSQKELARLYRVSTATIAVSLKKLEQGGYISRAVNQQDNRCNKICITDKGKAVVEESACYFAQLEKLMFQGFDREELEQFRDYLERIKGNLCTLLPEAERQCWERKDGPDEPEPGTTKFQEREEQG